MRVCVSVFDYMCECLDLRMSVMDLLYVCVCVCILCVCSCVCECVFVPVCVLACVDACVYDMERKEGGG